MGLDVLRVAKGNWWENRRSARSRNRLPLRRNLANGRVPPCLRLSVFEVDALLRRCNDGGGRAHASRGLRIGEYCVRLSNSHELVRVVATQHRFDAVQRISLLDLFSDMSDY